MSATFEAVLTRLREFGGTKVSELDALCAEHSTWLQGAVKDVRQQIAALAPAAKRQRVAGGAARAVEVEQQDQVLSGSQPPTSPLPPSPPRWPPASPPRLPALAGGAAQAAHEEGQGRTSPGSRHRGGSRAGGGG